MAPLLMSDAPRRARLLRIVLCVIVFAPVVTFAVAIAEVRYASPSDRERYAEAVTICVPFYGALTRTYASGEDSLPVREHENAHARQCATLGALRANLRGITNGGRLAREAEAYCAQARFEVARGANAYQLRERVMDDIEYGYMGMRRLGPIRIRSVFAAKCPGVDERAERMARAHQR